MEERCVGRGRWVTGLKERDRIGIWGFGNVSRDVALTLVDEGLGKEIVFYGRPREGFPNRAGAWVDDLMANLIHRPRMVGTNKQEEMAGLDAIFIGVGVPRRPGQTRSDLLAVNTEVIAKTTLAVKEVYDCVPEADLPILVYMGNPVTAMTWVGWKASGFPRAKVMGQAGVLDSRRICRALAARFGLAGNDLRGLVFGDHGDSMVASPRYFTVGGVPLTTLAQVEGVPLDDLAAVMEEAKKGGTHFVNEVGQSASAGPARAVGQMLRCVITGEPEILPVVAIITDEYGLLEPDDGLSSLGFGIPAVIGPNGVEKIIQLPVDDVQDQIRRSAGLVKEDIRAAAGILKQKFGID